jgi:hypothetical protein
MRARTSIPKAIGEQLDPMTGKALRSQPRLGPITCGACGQDFQAQDVHGVVQQQGR